MDKYDEQIAALRKAQEAERDKESKKLIPGYRKQWIGRCFKYHNSYGGSDPNKKWWLYAKILDIERINFIYDGTPEPNFRVFQFQNDKQGKIEFEIDRFAYRMDGWIEIKKSEYDKAYKSAVAAIKEPS